MPGTAVKRKVQLNEISANIFTFSIAKTDFFCYIFRQRIIQNKGVGVMSGLHREMGQRACELLPEQYRRFWAEESGNIPEYCEFLDLHIGAQWEEPEKVIGNW